MKSVNTSLNTFFGSSPKKLMSNMLPTTPLTPTAQWMVNTKGRIMATVSEATDCVPDPPGRRGEGLR